MARSRVLWLAEGLSQLIARVAPAERFPAFEKLLARMAYTASPMSRENLDTCRLEWFGCETGNPVPTAALELLAQSGSREAVPAAAVLAEPVSLHADLGRLFMTSVGIAHYDGEDQSAFVDEVENLLKAEGLRFESLAPGRWCILLDKKPEAGFMPLDQALGMDVADALPEGPGALPWRRLINESQITLHNSPVNQARTRSGQATANSLWFWGSGSLDELECAGIPQNPGAKVCSCNPVSRGLALMHNVSVHAPEDETLSAILDSGAPVLLDTPINYADPMASLALFDSLSRQIVQAVSSGKAELEFRDTHESVSAYDRLSHVAFWRRAVPLKSHAPPGATT